jgi:uncharacterized protein YllA (UPF0747 family)
VNRVKLPVGSRLVEERLEVDERERPSEAVETGGAYDALLERLKRHFADTPHKEWVLAKITASKGENLGDHFARLMIQLFGDQGLVLACPRIFRQEIGALTMRAIENPERIDRLLAQQKKAMEEKGYPSHTTWETSDPLHLYRLSEGTPLRLKYTGSKFVLEQTGGEMTPAQVAKEIKGWPHIYTNGVLLSPLQQDSCIPSVAHIAGPGGCEFFGVMKALFDDYRVAFPQVLPQVSATLVDRRCEKGLKDLGKSVDQLIADARAASAAGGDVPVDHGAALAQLRDGVLKAIDGYGDRAGQVAAETSRIAVEMGEIVARELEKLVGATRIGAAREAVLAAYAKYAERATQVSPTASGPLGEVRRRIEDALPDRHEAPGLALARQTLEKAATGLGDAAKPGTERAGSKLAAGLGSSLDQIARDAIDAAARGADANVSDADIAKAVCTPEGGLQEDHVGMIYFFNQRGPGLYKEVSDALDAFDFKHQIVYLD